MLVAALIVSMYMLLGVLLIPYYYKETNFYTVSAYLVIVLLWGLVIPIMTVDSFFLDNKIGRWMGNKAKRLKDQTSEDEESP